MDGNHQPIESSRFTRHLRQSSWLLSGLAIVGVCLAYRWYAPAGAASAQAPKSAPKSAVRQATAIDRARPTQPKAQPIAPQGSAATAPRKNPIAATVNNEPISRDDLGDECLLHYGAEVLESIVNRTLILVSCERRGITISDADVDAEIDRMAKKFQVGKDQWVKLLEKERGITPERYAHDIVWPTLALRELAKDQLQITRRELDQAYESEFGPGVKVRLIAIENPEKARAIHAEAIAKPEDFGALAKKHSQDANSASAYGLIQPIRRHLGDPKLEEVAFAMKKGEISQIVPVGNLQVFLKCEELLPPPKGIDRAKVEPHLYDALRERKLRTAANDVFKQLQGEAQVENIYNDPVKSKQMPGVAAIINGHQISIRELADECLDRYGDDVLEGTINRKIIDQAMRKRNAKLSDAEIEAEIERAAIAMGKVDANGKADVAAWLETVTANEGITKEVYVRDEVWPSAALKKLVSGSVQVTPEDMQRGYEANYGPKVRCRAIVLNNQRRAQEVWDKAREGMAQGEELAAKEAMAKGKELAAKMGKEQAAKVFGDLAAEYSIEVGSRSLRGEVPPIQKHGGQPVLEKEAFSLSAENPLSGILQVGSTYVILMYEGRTEPIGTNFNEVKKLLQADIQEKKLRVAMSKAFDNLRDNSHVDNFLTGEIKAAKKAAPGSPDAPLETGMPLPKVHKR
jgi:parvulin-like peptidyl-prolyl isomerase